MSTALLEARKTNQTPRGVMKANVFRQSGRFGLEEKMIPTAGPGDAVIEVRLTTISGIDLHIVDGGYPVAPGLTLGHEVVGVIHELGEGVTGYQLGERVLTSAITPCGQCENCQRGHTSQCCGPLGGWKLGNTIDGCQAEYVRVPYAQVNLTRIPDSLSDEEVLLLTNVASTGFAAAERGGVRIGDTVAVFGQGPVGLCATIGARLLGAAEIIAVDPNANRLRMARQMGATSVLLPEVGPVNEIREITRGRGVDVAIEAVGSQETFENAMRTLRPGGTLSSISVYTGQFKVSAAAIRRGLADQTIVTALCPGGKERMRRLMRMVETRRVDLRPLLTHLYRLEDIAAAYELFGSRKDDVLKIAIRVH